MNIVTISKRLGHGKPDITLRIYAHLFRKDDSKAAAINEALNGFGTILGQPFTLGSMTLPAKRLKTFAWKGGRVV